MDPPQNTHDHDTFIHPLDVRIAIVSVGAAVVWFRLWEPLARVGIIGLACTVAGGWPIFGEAWENLRSRRMTMELSMAIALVAALIIGEFFTALVITGFVLVAEILEGLTVGRGRRAIRELMDFLPATVAVRRTTGTIRIPLSEVHVGDVVLVAPGESVPVDGRVRAGHSFVNQSAITGESLPVEKQVGSTVYAGTVNQAGTLGYLVYFALGCAALTFAITRDARSTISVIIVAGACGIAAGTPLAILGAIGLAARPGAIIKGGRYLETLWNVRTIAFDKTGTVTFGTPEVRAIRHAAGVQERAVLEAAAIAERRSEHPFAAAILRAAHAKRLTPVEPDEFNYSPGGGIVARKDGIELIVGIAD